MLQVLKSNKQIMIIPILAAIILFLGKFWVTISPSNGFADMRTTSMINKDEFMKIAKLSNCVDLISMLM